MREKSPAKGETRDLLFLGKDLRWKTLEVQGRIARTRTQITLPSPQPAHREIIEMAMELAAQAGKFGE